MLVTLNSNRGTRDELDGSSVSAATVSESIASVSTSPTTTQLNTDDKETTQSSRVSLYTVSDCVYYAQAAQPVAYLGWTSLDVHNLAANQYFFQHYYGENNGLVA